MYEVRITRLYDTDEIVNIIGWVVTRIGQPRNDIWSGEVHNKIDRNSLDPMQSAIFNFADKEFAVLFKLTWGGK